MQVNRGSASTAIGPTEWFTGTVFIDRIASSQGESRLNAALVHFTPGARTAWHSHPRGQTLWVTDGIGLVQRQGGPIEVIRPGDAVIIEPGEDHWHGAAANRFMTHLAMFESGDDGSTATWGDHVSDEEYEAAPPIDG